MSGPATDTSPRLGAASRLVRREHLVCGVNGLMLLLLVCTSTWLATPIPSRPGRT